MVIEAGALIPKRHQSMLLNLMDLEKVTVEDIMVPRNEVTGIDIGDEWKPSENCCADIQYTRLPLYRETIDNVIGILHMRNVLPLLHRDQLDPNAAAYCTRALLYTREHIPEPAAAELPA